MTDTPGDVAARLEAWAQERADAALHHASRGDYSIAGKCEADEDRLRAAASLIRDMGEREKALREALEPFAKFANALNKETPDKISLGLYAGGDMFFGPDSGTVGDLRRAAKALEAK